MENREGFWYSKEAELIMDLLIDVTSRSNLMEHLLTIDPDYAGLQKAKEVYIKKYQTG